MSEQQTRFRYLGITDECVECQRCGRTELKSTVVLDVLGVDGNVEDTTYYGSGCAAKVLGISGPGSSRKVLDAARAAHRKVVDAAELASDRLTHYGIPTDGVVLTEQIYVAVGKYIDAHRKATWAAKATMDEWVDMVMDMIARHRSSLSAARRLGFVEVDRRAVS